MRRKLRQRTTPAVFVAVALSLFGGFDAFAQGRTSSPGPFVQLMFEPACADTERAALLARQIRMRLPDTMVVTGALDTPGDWLVRWTPVEGECLIEFVAGETNSTMPLPADAEKEQIELVASRVAFLTSVSPVPSEGEEAPLGVPGEELDEAALEAESTPPPEPDESVPPPPPPLDEGDETEPVEEQDPPPPDEVSEEAVEPAEEPVEPADPQPEDEEGEAGAERQRDPYFRPQTTVQPVPGVSLPSSDGRPIAPGFLFGVIGSSTEGVDGIAVSSIFNNQTEFADGIQLAPIFNNGGRVTAIQSAGIFNLAGTMEGIQTAGVLNIVRGGRGLGTQLAGVANIHSGTLDGFQVAGVTNISTDVVDGFAFAGAVNVSNRVKGAQIAAVNVAREVNGFQIGLVNVAEKSDVSIGLVNIIYSEPFWFTGETASDGFTLVGMRHGSTYLKWSVWLGSSAVSNQPVLLAGVGLGFHFPLGDFYIDGDIIGLNAASGASAPGTNAGTLELRLSGGYSLLSWLSIYAGAGIRGFGTDGADLGLVPNFAAQSIDETGGEAAWPFFFAGVRF